jgi:hypothetical protein
MNKLLTTITVLSVVAAPAFAQGYDPSKTVGGTDIYSRVGQQRAAFEPNQQPVKPYKPPPIHTFGDRVRDAIHSYPLEKGIGNNPTDQQMYIRQRAN